jgi:hypothetical protein
MTAPTSDASAELLLAMIVVCRVIQALSWVLTQVTGGVRLFPEPDYRLRRSPRIVHVTCR